MTKDEHGNPIVMKEQAEDTIDLLALFHALLKHWKAILLAIIICGGLAGAYNHYMIQSTYQANAEIYITNTDTLISFQELQVSAALTVDYQEIILSRAVLKQVIDDQKLDMTYEQLEGMITVENPKDSHCLKILVETSDPKQSVSIANSLVRYSTDQIYRVVGQDEPTVIDHAEEDAVQEIRPSLAKYIVLGAFVGAFAVCAVIAVVFLLDTTLKTEKDVETYLGYPVLSSIPYTSEEQNDAKISKRKVEEKNAE